MEADESSNLVCYSFDRVVERKARVPRSHVDVALNLNHCARFVFLARAIDQTDSPSFLGKAVTPKSR